MLARHQSDQELGRQDIQVAADSEHMILVQAVRDLTFPHAASSKLVDVTPFCHEDIARSECRASRLAGWDIYVLDVRQIRVPELHVRHPEIRIGFRRGTSVVFAKSQPRLHHGHVFEPPYVPCLLYTSAAADDLLCV